MDTYKGEVPAFKMLPFDASDAVLAIFLFVNSTKLIKIQPHFLKDSIAETVQLTSKKLTTVSHDFNFLTKMSINHYKCLGNVCDYLN